MLESFSLPPERIPANDTKIRDKIEIFKIVILNIVMNLSQSGGWILRFALNDTSIMVMFLMI
jgi:hypothetical protein